MANEAVGDVVLSVEAIQTRVSEIADQLCSEYGKLVSIEEPLVLVCVLKGSFIFCSDLFRSIGTRLPTSIDFMQFARGGQVPGEEEGEHVRLLTDLKQDVRGRHCLVVEDIIDTAATLEYLRFVLAARAPKSIATCALVNKQPMGAAEPGQVGAEYTGFLLPNERRFLVGYGMDYKERYRSLPFIGALDFAVAQADVTQEEELLFDADF